jgi:CMP-N-acetylneuraminic acid synthetase
VTNKKPKVLALIPARGGSRRLPGKNLLKLCGEPITVWSVKAAQQSKYVDRIVVSTDSDEIAEVARAAGADVPFMRPNYLASDTASSLDVVKHALNELNQKGQCYEFIVLLQPTSPLRTSKHIDESFELLQSKDADAIVGVTELDHPIELTNRLPDDLSMKGFFATDSHLRSQEFPKRYRVNGAIYLVRVESLIKENTIFLSDRIYAYKMDREVSVDIDTPYDLKLADALFDRDEFIKPF